MKWLAPQGTRLLVFALGSGVTSTTSFLIRVFALDAHGLYPWAGRSRRIELGSLTIQVAVTASGKLSSTSASLQSAKGL
jgi:hypothetical protein